MKKQELIRKISPKEDFVLIQNALVDLGKVTHIHIDKFGGKIELFFIGTDKEMWFSGPNCDKPYCGQFNEIPNPIGYLDEDSFDAVAEFLSKRFNPKKII